MGDRILYRKTVSRMNPEKKTVTCMDGTAYSADIIITTIPWKSVQEYEDCQRDIVENIGKLKYTGTEIKYISENLDTEAHWIYIPDPEIPCHRILVRHNFCAGSRGYWEETNLSRVTDANREYAFANEYTYPLNTIGKPEIMDRLLGYMRQRGVYGLGRWGEHEHYNSDRTVERAMELFQEIAEK